MIDHATRPTPASPLDPFLGPFLRQIDELTGGYAPTSQGARVAAALGWAPAFAEAVFVSARARGLVEPYRGGGVRGRARWGLSARGRAWADRPSDAVPEAAARDRIEDAAPVAT